MKVADAVLYGKAEVILAEAAPDITLQLGGCEAGALARAARKGEAAGFGAINLNMGCPSCRVGAGGFGAKMMLDIDNAARCLAAMKEAVAIPLSVKCRLAVDEQEASEVLPRLLEKLSAEGVSDFVIHARKAWLKGLSPRQNRTLPPLEYGLVYKMKEDYPHLNIIINGGITELEQVPAHLQKTDGVMIGRAAFANPFMLTALNDNPPSRQAVLEQWTHYALRHGLKPSHLTHYVSGLWRAQRGAAYFRRKLNGLKELTEQSAQELLDFTRAGYQQYEHTA